MKFLEGKRTYISLILASIALWSPQLGLDFTDADAGEVEAAINQFITQIAIFGGILGRKAAKIKS